MGPDIPGKLYKRDQIEERLKASFSASLDRLEVFWKAFGINEERTSERANLVLSHLTGLLGECVKEEEILFESLKERILGYLEELRKIASELDIKSEEPNESLSLLEREKILRTRLDELEQMKYSRIKEYKQLLKREARLCESLGMPKTTPSTSTVPKKTELCELEQHVHMLTDERERRYQKFCSAKRELTTIMEVTECSPETSFERDVICFDDEETFVLSRENLEQMTQVVKKFQQRMVEMKREKKLLIEKLEALWVRLSINEQERKLFLAQHNEIRQSTLQALRHEIERCEEIKKQNIGQYICKLRKELEDLWDKCCVDTEEKGRFLAFHVDDFTEYLLELHETEVERLKKRYEDTRGIFERIQKRKKLWDLMLIFERKASDPNRFTNRGGNLLQEERERRKLLKDLPKLEEEILQAIVKYEEQTDELFLVNGSNFAEYIRIQWADHVREKENEKLERQRQRTLLHEPGSFATPGKRAMFGTPATAPSKLQRTNGPLSALRSVARISKLASTPSPYTPAESRNKNACTVQKRRSARLKQAKVAAAKRGVLAERNELGGHNDPDATSYSQFATELNRNERNQFRSSVMSTKKKIHGSKISHSGTLRKSSSRSSRKSSTLLRTTISLKTPSKQSEKSMRSILRTPTKITPARSKLGLPFLI